MFSARQQKKYIEGKKIVYEFLVLYHNRPIELFTHDVPKKDENDQLILNEDKTSWETEKKITYATIKLHVDEGATETQIKTAVKRQLLEYQHQHETHSPDLNQAPDIEDIFLSH